MTDLIGMQIATDIPDWTVSECGLPFDLMRSHFIPPEFYEKMRASSPSSLIDHVITPTMILLGKGDRRVPPSQGLNWHYALKARKIESKLMIFEDTGHSLDTIEAEKYGFQEAASFFLSKINS